MPPVDKYVFTYSNEHGGFKLTSACFTTTEIILHSNVNTRALYHNL